MFGEIGAVEPEWKDSIVGWLGWRTAGLAMVSVYERLLLS